MNVELIIHNSVAVFSALLSLGAAFFLYINGKRDTANIPFAIVFLTIAIFYVTHVIGVSVEDSEISRVFLMFNLVIFFTGAATFHGVVSVLKKDKHYAVATSVFYATAISLSTFFLVFPDLLLLPSVPKMYFPNYYEVGVLNWIRMLYLFVFVFFTSFIIAYNEYKKAKGLERKQILFMMMALVLGYGTGFIPNLLMFDIPVDPLWGIFFVIIGVIPMVYGALKFELFNIRVIARQAFYYASAVVGVGGFITFLNYVNIFVPSIYPGFPTWFLSFISAVLAVSASVFVWKRLQEGELMKNEFITTVTHKFRTPLTYIKWSSDNLLNDDLPNDERKHQLEYIRMANEKLVELTDVLTSVSSAENTHSYEYNFDVKNVSHTIQGMVNAFSKEFTIKHFKVVSSIEPNLRARIDEGRIKFVAQVFIENALHYSSAESTIMISLYSTKREIIFSVKDMGVGLTKEQHSLLFTKFYRTNEARRLDTEGMGIGLYVSSQIMEKHGGRIWAESDGPGKGSTFYFALARSK